MATTKQTAAKRTSAAKKTTATKTAAKKTTAKKTTAAKRTSAVKQPVAKQSTATKTTNAVRESITSAAKDADETLKQYASVAGDQLVELRQLAREVVDIYVGIPFVLGSRFAETAGTPNVDLKSLVEDVKARLVVAPSVDFDAVKSFIDEAKAVGHARVTTFELQAAVAAETVNKRVAQLRSLYAA